MLVLSDYSFVYINIQQARMDHLSSMHNVPQTVLASLYRLSKLVRNSTQCRTHILKTLLKDYLI